MGSKIKYNKMVAYVYHHKEDQTNFAVEYTHLCSAACRHRPAGAGPKLLEFELGKKTQTKKKNNVEIEKLTVPCCCLKCHVLTQRFFNCEAQKRTWEMAQQFESGGEKKKKKQYSFLGQKRRQRRAKRFTKSAAEDPYCSRGRTGFIVMHMQR